MESTMSLIILIVNMILNMLWRDMLLKEKQNDSVSKLFKFREYTQR